MCHVLNKGISNSVILSLSLVIFENAVGGGVKDLIVFLP
jgi:hypothetical protein